MIKKLKKIEKYSFTFNCNGLALMPKDENKKNRILLCACKKYLKDQRNGILLVNPQLEDNHEVTDAFYETKDFEVHCFCPIFANEEKSKIFTTNSTEIKDFKNAIKEKTGTEGWWFNGGFYLDLGYNITEHISVGGSMGIQSIIV